MNTLLFEILQLTVSLMKNQTTGKVEGGATIAETLLSILKKANQAYQDHTGQPVDPSLIQPAKLLAEI